MYRKILELLLTMGIKFGTVFPSIASIAAAIGCNPRTVTNGLRWLKRSVSWTGNSRIKRRPTRLA